MNYHTHESLSKEQDKRETIQCAVWASVVVFGMLALLCHGLAFLSWTEPTMTEIYARKQMKKNIEILEERVKSMEIYATEILKLNYQHFEYLNHTHRYFDGKIR